MTFIKREINLLYTNNLFRGIAFSLFGIFIPVYLLTIGFSLQVVFAYFLVFQITTFLGFFGGWLAARKIGYKGLIITSALFVMTFITLLSLLDLKEIFVYGIALIAGFQNAFYYFPLHAYFTKLSKKKTKGKQYSIYSIFGQVSGLFGPLMGALIASFFSFRYLFLFSLIFIAVSLIPLFYLKNFKPEKIITPKKFRGYFKSHKGFFFANIMDNIKGEIDGIIWPIFAFLALKNLISIGWVEFLITIGTMIFTFFLGKHFDSTKRKFLFIRVGAILFAAVWVLRGFIDNPVFVYTSSILAGFFGLMVSVPFTAIFYHKAGNEKESAPFIMFTEIPTFIGRVTLWTLAVILVNNFRVFFIFAAIASLSFAFWEFGAKGRKKELG